MVRLVTLTLLAVLVQEPTPIRLGKPTGELTETFTAVGSIRELPDGRIIVTDPRENRIVTANFATNGIQSLARVGGGPGEYEAASPVYALNGDSSIMVDIDSRRWLVLFRDRVIATMPPDARGPRMVGSDRVLGSDGRGNVLIYRRAPIPTGRSTTSATDSGVVMRVSIASARLDTVARIRPARLTSEVARNEKGEVTSTRQVMPNPYVSDDPVAACSDGWVAIVRLDPYRVDWSPPSGALIRGALLAHDAVRLTSAERQAYMARVSRETGRPVRNSNVYPEWPEQIPAVEAQSYFPAICSPSGHVLVNRAKSMGRAEPRYDVIDRRGVRLRQIILSANEQIVAFGSRSIYIVYVDDDGASHVRRYASH